MGEVIVYISEENEIEPLCQFGTWVALSSNSTLRIISRAEQEEVHELHLPCGVPPEVQCQVLHKVIRSVQDCMLRQLGEETRIDKECSESDSPLELKIESVCEKISCADQLKSRLRATAKDLLVMAWEGAGSRMQETIDFLHRLPCGFITIDTRSASLSLKKVLIGVSGGKDAPSILPWIKESGRRTRIHLELLYVLSGEEETEVMGRQVFKRILSAHGIKNAEDAGITCRTLCSKDPAKALADCADESQGTLILLGFSRKIGLQRMVFGKINDHLKQQLKSAEYGVIRTRKTWKQIVRDRFESMCNISVPQLGREERIGVYESMDINSRIGFDFVLQMSLASCIASLGLMSNSAAVIIGAMLVAPLMTPILACGLALIQQNLVLLKTALKSLTVGFLMAVFIGWSFGLLSLDSSMPITDEMISRGKPGVPDLIVALLSGVAAAYCQGRQKLSAALAGVAIAAALVPPLASIGLCVRFGYYTEARGALTLFATNVLAIILGGAIAFFAVGIRSNKKRRWASQATTVILLGLVMLFFTLNFDRISRLFEREIPSEKTIHKKLHALISDVDVISRTVQHKDGGYILTLKIECQHMLTKEEVRALKLSLDELCKVKLKKLKIHTTLVSVE